MPTRSVLLAALLVSLPYSILADPLGMPEYIAAHQPIDHPSRYGIKSGQVPNIENAQIKAQAQVQAPLSDIMPPSLGGSPPDPNNDNNDENPSERIMISDVIGKTRSINIFGQLTRQVASVSQRLDNQSVNTTVLAPLNSVMQGLERKPWEDDDNDDASSLSRRGKAVGGGGIGGKLDEEQRANENLRRFVERHVVLSSPWKEGEKVDTLFEGGKQVWWEKKDGKRVVMPGNIEVEGVQETVSNGEVWILKGVVR